jgi:hypothetical protein
VTGRGAFGPSLTWNFACRDEHTTAGDRNQDASRTSGCVRGCRSWSDRQKSAPGDAALARRCSPSRRESEAQHRTLDGLLAVAHRMLLSNCNAPSGLQRSMEPCRHGGCDFALDCPPAVAKAALRRSTQQRRSPRTKTRHRRPKRSVQGRRVNASTWIGLTTRKSRWLWVAMVVTLRFSAVTMTEARPGPVPCRHRYRSG